MRFRRHHRLRRPADFARVYANRCYARHGPIVVYVAPNGLETCRLGLSVGKKVGNAVRRNLLRRRTREAFRKIRGELPPGLDIIWVARPGAQKLRAELSALLQTLVTRAHRRRVPPESDSKPRSVPNGRA